MVSLVTRPGASRDGSWGVESNQAPGAIERVPEPATANRPPDSDAVESGMKLTEPTAGVWVPARFTRKVIAGWREGKLSLVSPIRLHGPRFLGLRPRDILVLGRDHSVAILGRAPHEIARLVRSRDPEAAQRLFGPGTRWGHLATLTDPTSSSAELLEAAQGLAATLKPAFKRRQTQQALRREAASREMEPETLMRTG